jgi:hypothetical protein
MDRRSIRTRSALVACGLLASAALGMTAGCTQSTPGQSTIIQDAPPAGITPVQRGQIRREAVEFAQSAMDAWQANDVNAMKKYFSQQYIDYYTDLYAKYAKQGKVRVRDIKITSLDASDMNNTGTQVLIDVEFVDNQYFKSKSGQRLTKPSGDKGVFQLTLDKHSGTWQITRIIGASDQMN